MKTQIIFSRPIYNGLFWGIVGGIALILVPFLTNSGLLQITPYLFILCGAVLTIKYSTKPTINFSDLFLSDFLAFIIMSFILYFYVINFENPHSGITFLGHLWRFGLVFGLGISSSLLISFIAKPTR